MTDRERHPLDRTGNLLGAVSLAITDRTSAAAGESLGRSESAAVALSALYHFLDQPSVDRLRQDARAIARMKHPNIIGTSYFGEDGGRWFFVMDLVEGGTVDDRLESYQASLA